MRFGISVLRVSVIIIISWIALPTISISQEILLNDRSFLKSQIDSMEKEDQKWRSMIRMNTNGEIDDPEITESYLLSKMRSTDSLNFFKLQALFNQYGFVHIDMIDSASAHNFWLLVQHQDKHPDFQQEVLVQIHSYCLKGLASVYDYVYLLDRVRINTDRLQVYGTQVILKDDSTGFMTKPVIDPENLNKRRKEVGLFSIEEYLDMMNERYQGSLKDK